MSVWDSLVGQKPVIDMLSRIAQGDPSQITQSWLICGPPGSGRSNMARAFAAALESPDHGMSAEPTRVTQQVLAGTHPDVTVLTTNKVTIGIDQVREIITTSEQMPATAPWRIIIIEDVDRMLERTTNVLLKEIEEPAEHCIWLLCAPSAQDVLPTIRSRTRIVNLAVPSTQAVAGFLTSTTNVEPKVAQRAARLAEGHIGIAKLYATDERVMSDRDELVVGVLNLARASDAVLLAGNLIDNAKAQAEELLEQWKAGEATEESFAALAMEHSSDSSKYTGGLYTEVYHDQMVTTFNDWCFDPARQTGDTGIIHNESTGYHVMYFVGYDQPYWEIQVSADLVNDAVDTFYEEKTEGYTAEQSSFGMSFVG